MAAGVLSSIEKYADAPPEKVIDRQVHVNGTRQAVGQGGRGVERIRVVGAEPNVFWHLPKRIVDGSAPLRGFGQHDATESSHHQVILVQVRLQYAVKFTKDGGQRWGRRVGHIVDANALFHLPGVVMVEVHVDVQRIAVNESLLRACNRNFSNLKGPGWLFYHISMQMVSPITDHRKFW